MKTSMNKVEEAARRLSEAWEHRAPTTPIRVLLEPGDIDAAYAVQRINAQARIAAGERVAGRKIGITAKAIQQQLGIDQPDYGVLFARDLLREDQPILPDDVMQPRVEGEVALVLEHPLAMERPSVSDVIRATAFALPAIEVLSSRIANWDIGIQDTIADNASAQAVALGGRPCLLRDLDLELGGMTMSKNGELVAFGVTAACLGNPLNAAAWLARRMVEVGLPLQAGDVVMTGALAPMVTVVGGDTVEVRIAGMGAVRAAFARR